MRITGRSTLFLLAAAALLSLATPADAYRLDETWERSFDVDEGAQFGLENVNGAISVEGWDRDEIQVSARIRIKAPSKDRAKKIFRMIEFDVEADRSAVTIKADLPRVRKGFFGWFGDNNEAIRVEYVVRVPHETDLDIESVNGRIDIEEVGGMFRVKTVNGGIDMDMLGGEGDVGTVNGGIGCSIRDFPHGGELNVKTLNGSVEIGLPGDLDAELDLKTTNGRIRVGFDIEDARTVKKRRVRATVGKGDGLVQVRTLNGGIRIGEL